MGKQTDIFDYLGQKDEEVEGMKYKTTVSVITGLNSFKRLYFDFDSVQEMKEFKKELSIVTERESKWPVSGQKTFIFIVSKNEFIEKYLNKEK